MRTAGPKSVAADSPATDGLVQGIRAWMSDHGELAAAGGRSRGRVLDEGATDAPSYPVAVHGEVLEHTGDAVDGREAEERPARPDGDSDRSGRQRLGRDAEDLRMRVEMDAVLLPDV